MKILIIGAGYIGTPLAQALAGAGHEVHGIRRTMFETEGITAHGIDILDRDALDALKPDFDWVINTVSSSRGDAEAHRAVFIDGSENVHEWLANSKARLLFTSSTSVYPQTDGGWVDEECPDEPEAGTGHTLALAEEMWLDSAATILRVAGIYGPERGYLYQQFLKGEAVLPEGERWLNMIHRDDVVGAILAAMEIEPGIYNAADDEPVTRRAFFEWLSERLDRPMPPPGEVTARKRIPTNKRVRNAKLKAAGWQLKYPTYREGYEALIRADQGGPEGPP